MSDVLMPTPTEGVEAATIARWLKRDGETVAAGDELLEIETDKVTIVHVADESGVLRISAEEGSFISVGAVIGRLVDVSDGEDAPPRAPVASAPAAAAMEHAAPAATVVVAATRPSSIGVRATPLARLMAEKRGIDLGAIRGTGPHGLVTRTDLPGEAVAPAASTAARPIPGRVEAGEAQPRLEPMSRMQRVIAQRMVEAKTTVPEFHVETDVAVDELLALRGQIKELGDLRVPSINDFVIKAAAIALREHPRVNGSYQDDGFLLHPYVNVGFAVAADDALIVPTIRNTDKLSVLEISTETRRLADRVRSGTVTAEDVTGGTFTVSNLGMFGMTAITPIINVPQAAILGVGAARGFPIIDEAGALRTRSLMTLTLSCDHRIIYGSDAARFLSLVGALLEQPMRIALDP
jgi:pyruvate dehydrogenase E2 component (dihydrolipoamide acetyltransferase)